MRFLIDRCAGQLLADWLRQQGHDVVDSRELGPDPRDRALLEWAVKETRILVTIDTDFGELIYLENVSPAGLVRLPDVPARERQLIMQDLLTRYETELQDGAIITVRGGRSESRKAQRRTRRKVYTIAARTGGLSFNLAGLLQRQIQANSFVNKLVLLLMHTSLSGLVSALVLCLIATGAHAQNEVVRAVVLGQPVEFTMSRSNEAADFETVSVRIGGKLLKQFATPYGSFLIVVATFNGCDGDYLLLRTSMGQGACAGGSLYALKFSSIGDQQPPTRINVNVSPVLMTCLGEFPPVKFTYGAKGDLVLSVSGYELRGDVWLRWVPERKPTPPKKVVQHNKSHRRKRTALSSAGVGYLLGCMPGGSIPALNASVRDDQVLS